MNVSIVIIAFNQTSTVLLACKRLSQQMTAAEGEILIVDASSEEFPQQAKAVLRETEASISYIRLQENSNGRTAGRNIGIEQASGRVVILLDGDMVPTDNFVAGHLAFHTGTEGRILGTGHRTWLGDLSEAAGIFSILTNDWLAMMIRSERSSELTVREMRELKKRDEFISSATPWRACFTCNLSFLRSDFVPFDEKYSGWCFEDWDFAWQMFKRGARPVFRRDLNAYHIENANFVGNIFRNPSQSGIVQYLHNSFYFYERCLDLSWEDVFMGSDRVRYTQDHFEIVSRSNSITPERMRQHLLSLRSAIDKTETLYKRPI